MGQNITRPIFQSFPVKIAFCAERVPLIEFSPGTIRRFNIFDFGSNRISTVKYIEFAPPHYASVVHVVTLNGVCSYIAGMGIASWSKWNWGVWIFLLLYMLCYPIYEYCTRLIIHNEEDYDNKTINPEAFQTRHSSFHIFFINAWSYVSRAYNQQKNA